MSTLALKLGTARVLLGRGMRAAHRLVVALACIFVSAGCGAVEPSSSSPPLSSLCDPEPVGEQGACFADAAAEGTPTIRKAPYPTSFSGQGSAQGVETGIKVEMTGDDDPNLTTLSIDFGSLMFSTPRSFGVVAEGAVRSAGDAVVALDVAGPGPCVAGSPGGAGKCEWGPTVRSVATSGTVTCDRPKGAFSLDCRVEGLTFNEQGVPHRVGGWIHAQTN